MKRAYTFKYFLIYFFLFLPVIAYLVYSWCFSSRLFYSDDFHLLKTILWSGQEATLSGKINVFFDQHNEHRIIIPRLIALGNFKLNGYISWPGLIVFGSCLWASILYFFWKIFRAFNVKEWMFIPLPLILLQPQAFDNVTWAISILQQSVIVVLFVVLAFLLSRKRHTLALLVCLLATFTHGNGMLSFPIGIFIIGFIEKKWKLAGIWLLVFMTVCLIYFNGFNAGQNANFKESLGDPLRLILSFFAFFGGVTRVVFSAPGIASAAGFLMLLLLTCYLANRLWKFSFRNRQFQSSHKFFLILYLFLTSTAAMVCISRSWSGFEGILAPRYLHYSAFIFCLCYLLAFRIIKEQQRKVFALLMIFVAICFSFLSYFKFHEEIMFHQKSLEADNYNWNHNETFMLYRQSFNNNIREAYREAIQKGICRRNESIFDQQLDTLQMVGQQVALTNSTVAINNSGTEEMVKVGRISNNSLVASAAYIYFRSAQGKGFIYATRRNRNSILNFISGKGLYRQGFSSEYFLENLPKGKYRVGLIYDGKFSWLDNDYAILF